MIECLLSVSVTDPHRITLDAVPIGGSSEHAHPYVVLSSVDSLAPYLCNRLDLGNDLALEVISKIHADEPFRRSLRLSDAALEHIREDASAK